MALYDAFISYSHAKDKPVAAALQSAIQKLGKPWYRRRIVRLFRDDTSLSATPHLWPMIEQALGQSRHFLLLASPKAAASKWVNKEVAYWLEQNSIDTLLVGLTDGELVWDDAIGDFATHGEAGIPLPPVLAKRFPNEPKWVDLRPYRAGADKRDATFTELAAEFAAAIRGMPKEDLLSQEVRQQRRALTLAWSASASLLILAIAASVAGVLAYREKQKAERTLAAATTSADSLVTDIAVQVNNATNIPSTLVKDILDRARKLEEQLIRETEDSPVLRSSESKALNATAMTLNHMGEYADGLASAQQAKSILQRLVTVRPDSFEFQHALAASDRYAGDALLGLGRLDEALASYRDRQAILQTLIAKDQDNVGLQEEVASAPGSIAMALRAKGNLNDALASYRASLNLHKQLITRYPDNLNVQIGVGLAYNNVGYVLNEQGKLSDALAAFQQAMTIAQAIATKNPDHFTAQAMFLTAESNLGQISLVLSKFADALQYCNDAIAAADRLATNDAQNVKWQYILADCRQIVGDVQSNQNDITDALASYRDVQERAHRWLKSNPGSVSWQRHLLNSDEASGYLQMKLRDFAGAEKSYTEALTILQNMAKEAATDLSLQYELAATYQDLAKVYAATRPRADALTALRQARTIMVRLTTLAPNNAEWKSELDTIDAQIASSQ